MNILSPLDSFDEVDVLADAGAGEFYCGLLEDEWHDKYPVISINRRPAGKGHFRRFSDLKEAVNKSHNRGIRVFFTLNEHYYIDSQYVFLKKYIDCALEAGVDALIVSDYALMAYLKQEKYRVSVHVSTGGTVFNWRSAEFYMDLGAERITFPRHLTIEETSEIISKMPMIETTVFVMNSRCVNIDGFCTFQHGLAGKNIFPMFRNACMLPFDTTVHCNSREEKDISFRMKKQMLQRQKIWEKVHVDDYPCGACALYEFKEMGITSVKIVGRGNSLDRKTKDVLFLKQLIECLDEKTYKKDDYRKKTQSLYRQTYNRSCRLHMCYYPSVMLTS